MRSCACVRFSTFRGDRGRSVLRFAVLSRTGTYSRNPMLHCTARHTRTHTHTYTQTPLQRRAHSNIIRALAIALEGRSEERMNVKSCCCGSEENPDFRVESPIPLVPISNRHMLFLSRTQIPRRKGQKDPFAVTHGPSWDGSARLHLPLRIANRGNPVPLIPRLSTRVAPTTPERTKRPKQRKRLRNPTCCFRWARPLGASSPPRPPINEGTLFFNAGSSFPSFGVKGGYPIYSANHRVGPAWRSCGGLCGG